MSDARGAIALLQRSRLVQVALGSVAVVSVLAIAWILSAHAFDVQRGLVGLPPHASSFDVLSAAVRREGVWLEEMVGIFGSHETLAPLATYLIWWVLIATSGIAAVVVDRRRDERVLLGLVATCGLVPIAIQILHARNLGIVWQGHYTLPAAVGIPILASVIVGTTRRAPPGRHWFEVAIVVGAAVASFLGCDEALRRYAVGVNGPILFFHPRWQPAGGVITWLVVNLAATSLLAGALWHLGPARSNHSERCGVGAERRRRRCLSRVTRLPRRCPAVRWPTPGPARRDAETRRSTATWASCRADRTRGSRART